MQQMEFLGAAKLPNKNNVLPAGLNYNVRF